MKILLVVILLVVLALAAFMISLSRNPLRKKYLKATLKDLPHLIPRYFA
jgi:uncharacterized protein YneF (UPF0154 family)